MLNIYFDRQAPVSPQRAGMVMASRPMDNVQPCPFYVAGLVVASARQCDQPGETVCAGLGDHCRTVVLDRLG